jgi:hypothetical protein
MQRLQTQQNAALRRILKAFHSTPTIALHNKAALPPVSVRLQSKQRKYTLHILSLPPSHPVVKRCRSSFPIPNHLSTALYDPNEYDFDWSWPCRPPSRLVRAVPTLGPWVLPDADIEDTAQPMATPWTTPTVRQHHMAGKHHTATATPPLRLQQPAPKPSIFASDSDSQHSFTYLWKFSESSTLISLISVAKSEFSRLLAHPTTRNATKTSPTPRPTAQTVWECVPSPCGPS